MTHTRLRPSLVSALAGTLLLGLPAGVRPLPAQQPERYTLRGSDVAVYNLVGEVRLESGSGAEVVVEVARGGRDAGALKVETGPIGGRETLRVIYPDDRIVFRGGESGGWWNDRISVREDGTFGDGGRSGGRRVTIAGSGDGLDARATLTVRVPKGQRVSVYLAAGDASVANVDGDVLVDVASASVTARNTRGRLTLDTGSGEVSVTDADGEVDVDAGSGGVRLSNVTGRSLRVDAGSGSLTGEGVDVPSIDLDLGSGRTRLSRVSSEDVKVDAGSGAVDLALTSDVKSVVIDAGSGSVTLTVPPSLGAEVDIETGSGGVETDLPITVTRHSRSRLTGRIGDGNGRIKIETGSGGVRIRKG